VQRRELTERDRSTAFWSNTGLGLFLTIAGIGLSWPLADLYREPEVQPLFAVLSLTFLLTALGTTQGAILIRNLSFRSRELRTIVATSTAVAIGIVLAGLGYGPWAIIAQSLAVSGISTFLLWRSSPWRPHFVFSIASLTHLLDTEAIRQQLREVPRTQRRQLHHRAVRRPGALGLIRLPTT
jgi:O-antigen/teichoic acid export membrane protein